MALRFDYINNYKMDNKFDKIMEIQKNMELLNKELLNEIKILNIKIKFNINDDIKIIDGFSNYAVSDKGIIYDINLNEIVIPTRQRHYYVYLASDTLKKKKTLLVQRLVATAFLDNPNNKPLVAHINEDKYDNRKENLRWATRREIGMNKLCHKNTSSIYKGVNWKKSAKKFRSRIRMEQRDIHLGYFNDEKEAARKYNEAAIFYYGEFARLNVIE